jgi:pyrimidine deaminase RibD-like protein
MPIVKLSCEHCGKNHTCKRAVVQTEIKEVYIYKKTRDEIRKAKIEQMKPVVKKQTLKFNVMN